MSFIFATGGMAFLLLSFCYLVIDVLGWWNGAPFCYPGWYLLSKKYHTRSDCSTCVILLDVFLKLYFIVPYWVKQSNPHKCSLAQLCGTVDAFSAQTWYENQQVRHHMKWIFLFFFSLVNHITFSFLLGMNSILVYVGSEILGSYFPFSWKVSGHEQHADLLAMNLVGTTVWLTISYYLYCIKFFVKI